MHKQETWTYVPGALKGGIWYYGQGGLACCDSWGRRVGHDWATELNWTEPTSKEVDLVRMSEIQYLCWYLKERRHHLGERGKEEGWWRDCQRPELLNQEWGAHVWDAAVSEVGQTTWPETCRRQVADAPVPWLIPWSEQRNSGRLVGGTACVYSRMFLSVRCLREAVKWAAEFWGWELRGGVWTGSHLM